MDKFFLDHIWNLPKTPKVLREPEAWLTEFENILLLLIIGNMLGCNIVKSYFQ